MVGFGGAGGLGGLGGMGTSFPARHAAPNSQTVDYMPVATDWLSDWQARYDAEEARRGQGASAGGPSKEDYIRSVLGSTTPSNVTWQPEKDIPAFTNHLMTGGQLYYGDAKIGEEVARYSLGDSLYNQLRNYTPAPASPGYQPDFTALNAEKQKMQPLFEAQTANTQAYQNMTGNGMIGGVLGPGYEAPNFGQVNGEFGQSTAGAQTGLDMNWTDGAYKPGGSGSGVYAPNPYNTIRWGL
jgi:hypothetical protein